MLGGLLIQVEEEDKGYPWGPLRNLGTMAAALPPAIRCCRRWWKPKALLQLDSASRKDRMQLALPVSTFKLESI